MYDSFSGEGKTGIWKKEDVDSFQKLRKKVDRRTLYSALIMGALGVVTGIIAAVKGKVPEFSTKRMEMLPNGSGEGGIGLLLGVISGDLKGNNDLNKFIDKTDAKNQ